MLVMYNQENVPVPVYLQRIDKHVLRHILYDDSFCLKRCLCILKKCFASSLVMEVCIEHIII